MNLKFHSRWHLVVYHTVVCRISWTHSTHSRAIRAMSKILSSNRISRNHDGDVKRGVLTLLREMLERELRKKKDDGS